MTENWFALSNIMIDQSGEAWAVYRINSVSYPLLPETRKLALLGNLAAFAAGASGDFTIWRVHRAAGTEVYVAIRLARSTSQSPWSAIAGRLLRTSRPMPGRLLLARAETSRMSDAERSVRAHVIETLSGRAATSAELASLFTRMISGLGLDDEDIDHNGPAAPIALVDDTLSVEPCTIRYLASTSGQVNEQVRMLEFVEGDANGYQAVLTVGVLPDGLEFPGRAALLFGPLERAGITVDAAIHAEWVPNARALRLAGRSIVDAENSATEQLSTGRIQDTRLATQLGTAVAYKQYLEGGDCPPILRATICLRVSAPTSELLDDTVAQLKAAFAPVHVAQPSFVQRDLWASFDLPGRKMPHACCQPLTVEQFAALMPIATEQVGTHTGEPIGRIPSTGRAVRLDLRAASRSARPPSILCVGTLGSGKTVTSQLLALQALREGSLVVDVDPKPDHRLDQLPELAGRSTIIDLSDVDHHAGLLDPLRIAQPELRDEIAASFYAELTAADPRTRAVIRAALGDLPAGESTSAEFVELLAARIEPEAHNAAEQLRAWSRSGLAKLALGAPASLDVGVPQRDLTSIRCRTLSLPSSTTPRSEYTDAERVSAAIMRLIAAYAMRLTLGTPERHKLLLIDEAWLLLASSDGRALVDRINRTGRSENATLLLATQQLGDAEHVAPLIGTHFVFGVETAREASLAAQLLGIDDTPEIVQLLTNQRAGMAVMRDTRGQLARVQIEPGTELLTALSTTPLETA